ncbi:MAG: type 1 glutamine amidotransferase, partial [bacterium]
SEPLTVAESDCYDILILLGGPHSIRNPPEHILNMLNIVERFLSINKTIFGHCLGAQIIALILGSEIEDCPTPEYGWTKLREINSDRNFCAFQSHSEGFATIPDGSVLLWESDAWKNQGFVKGSALAMQFHIEVRLTEIQSWCASNQNLDYSTCRNISLLNQSKLILNEIYTAHLESNT